MKHSDFLIGRDFQCGPRRWRCTDIGTRVIIAVMLDHDKDDQSWYNGPPYALLETVSTNTTFRGVALTTTNQHLTRQCASQKTAQSMKSTVRKPTLAAGGHSWLL